MRVFVVFGGGGVGGVGGWLTYSFGVVLESRMGQWSTSHAAVRSTSSKAQPDRLDDMVSL